MKKKIVGVLVCTLLLIPILSTTVVADDNNPPNPPKIDGPISGKIGETYTYEITLTDPDQDDIMFNLEVDFGDEVIHYDCGCGKSWQNGTVIAVSHKWENTGSYGITARAEDASGEWSEWSDPFIVIVTTPRNRAINNPFLNFLKNHPLIYQLLQRVFNL